MSSNVARSTQRLAGSGRRLGLAVALAGLCLLAYVQPLQADVTSLIWSHDNFPTYSSVSWVKAGQPYAKVHSRSPVGLHTQMSLLGGRNLNGGDTIVTTEWSARGPDEQWLYSDILYLTGIEGDRVVLQMNYNARIMPPGKEALWASTGEQTVYVYTGEAEEPWISVWWYLEKNGLSEIASHDDRLWNFHGSWARAGKPLTLGAFGVDTVNNRVWVVIDRDGIYAPEPTTLAVLALGGLAVLRRRRL